MPLLQDQYKLVSVEALFHKNKKEKKQKTQNQESLKGVLLFQNGLTRRLLQYQGKQDSTWANEQTGRATTVIRGEGGR